MPVLKAPSVELAVDDRIKDRLGALMEVSTLDFRAMTFAAGLDPKTSFRGKRIHFLDFGESDLTGFDFSGADLTGCNFSHAKIDGAVFAAARLDKVRGIKKRVPNVFISYSSVDCEIARFIADGLESRDVVYFMVDDYVSVIQVIENNLIEIIQEKAQMLFIASAKSLKDFYTNVKLNYTIDKFIRQNFKITIVLADVSTKELPSYLHNMLTVNIFDLEFSLDRIAEVANQWHDFTISPIISNIPNVLPNENNQQGDDERRILEFNELLNKLIACDIQKQFALFIPMHYGYDLHGVYIDRVSHSKFSIEARGSVSATVQLYGPRSDSGYSHEYHSRFKAIFSTHAEKDEYNTEGVELDDVNLEKGSWIDMEY